MCTSPPPSDGVTGRKLRFNDVFILFPTHVPNCPMVQELRRLRVPVKVLDINDATSVNDVARAKRNHVTAAWYSEVHGLERRLVFGVEGQDKKASFFSMSRCTSQVFWFV